MREPAAAIGVRAKPLGFAPGPGGPAPVIRDSHARTGKHEGTMPVSAGISDVPNAQGKPKPRGVSPQPQMGFTEERELAEGDVRRP